MQYAVHPLHYHLSYECTCHSAIPQFYSLSILQTIRYCEAYIQTIVQLNYQMQDIHNQVKSKFCFRMTNRCLVRVVTFRTGERTNCIWVERSATCLSVSAKSILHQFSINGQLYDNRHFQTGVNVADFCSIRTSGRVFVLYIIKCIYIYKLR